MTVLTGPWSYSRVTSCSLVQYREKVLRDPPSGKPDDSFGTDRRALGSILHLGAETAIKALRQRGKWPNPEKLAMRLLAMDDFSHLVEEKHYIVEAMSMFPDRVDLDVDQLLDQELEIAFDGDWNPVNFWKAPVDGWRAKIDLAQMRGDRLKVTDYKNRPAIFSQAELKVDGQLSLYPYLLAKRYPQVREVPDVETGIYYFQFGHDQSIVLTWEEIDANVEKLFLHARRKEAMSEDVIGPEPGFGKCQYCDYINDCPDGEQFLSKGGINLRNEEEVVQLAKRVFVVGEWQSSARSAINKYTKEHGPVMVDESSGFGHVMKESFKYDSKHVAKILSAAGHDPSQYMNVDKKAVDKLAKEDEALGQMLKAAGKITTATKFQEFKPVKAKVKGKNRDS